MQDCPLRTGDKNNNKYYFLFLPKLKGKIGFKKIKITVGRNIERSFTYNKCIFEVYCLKMFTGHCLRFQLNYHLIRNAFLYQSTKTKTPPGDPLRSTLL